MRLEAAFFFHHLGKGMVPIKIGKRSAILPKIGKKIAHFFSNLGKISAIFLKIGKNFSFLEGESLRFPEAIKEGKKTLTCIWYLYCSIKRW